MKTAEVATLRFLTYLPGDEEPAVRTFALLPEGWQGDIAEHPMDALVYHWCTPDEWDNIVQTRDFAGVILLSEVCGACDERLDEYACLVVDGYCVDCCHCNEHNNLCSHAYEAYCPLCGIDSHEEEK